MDRKEYAAEITPVYRQSAAYAREHGEQDAYRASNKANMECKDAIVDAIYNNYHDNRLDTKTTLAQLAPKFGLERVSYLLAVTVQFKDHDGRFSDANKAWAKSVPVTPNGTEWGNDRNVYLVVDQAHPGLVDLLVTQVRKELAQEKEQPEKKPSILEKIQKTSASSKSASAPKKQKEEVL